MVFIPFIKVVLVVLLMLLVVRGSFLTSGVLMYLILSILHRSPRAQLLRRLLPRPFKHIRHTGPLAWLDDLVGLLHWFGLSLDRRRLHCLGGLLLLPLLQHLAAKLTLVARYRRGLGLPRETRDLTIVVGSGFVQTVLWDAVLPLLRSLLEGFPASS